MTAKLTLPCLLSLALTGSALADHRGRVRRVWAPPQYEIQEREIIIPAEYETVYEKVWVEPVYEIRTHEVYVPGPYRERGFSIRTRDVDIVIGLGGSREHGHYKTIEQRVLVEPGHWTTVERTVCVRPERVEIVRDRVLVRDGFWKKRHRGFPRPRGRVRGHVRAARFR